MIVSGSEIVEEEQASLEPCGAEGTARKRGAVGLIQAENMRLCQHLNHNLVQ
jgi:hypothetical protein